MERLSASPMDEPTLTVRAPGAEPTALDRQAWAAQPGAGRDIGELVPGRRGSAAPLDSEDTAHPHATRRRTGDAALPRNLLR